MSELIEVGVPIPSGPMAADDLANRITFFVSACVNDGVPVNGSCGIAI